MCAYKVQTVLELIKKYHAKSKVSFSLLQSVNGCIKLDSEFHAKCSVYLSKCQVKFSDLLVTKIKYKKPFIETKNILSIQYACSTTNVLKTALPTNA